MIKQTFWLIWCFDADVDINYQVIDSLEAAKTLALEMSDEYQTNVYVLKAVGAYIQNTPHWESLNELPLGPSTVAEGIEGAL